MEIRTASESDIPGIVGLLKVSLGESLMPKSERYWRWKHIENPFGVSPVLIAESGGRIAGVRAFMRWTWKNDHNKIEAVRAVDTATHPDFQGKGIFSRLTRALVKECESKGIGLVYNTPNKSSLPGYLKMDWQKAGRYPVVFGVRQPVAILKNMLIPNGKAARRDADGSVADFLRHPGLAALLTAARREAGGFTTLHTVRSLEWRYADVPVANYYADGLEKDGALLSLFFYRLKESGFGRELRVTDLFLGIDSALATTRKLLREKAKAHHADYITFGGLTAINPLDKMLSLKSRAFGPVVTIRKVGHGDLSAFSAFKNWSPSLGDLELF